VRRCKVDTTVPFISSGKTVLFRQSNTVTTYGGGTSAAGDGGKHGFRSKNCGWVKHSGLGLLVYSGRDKTSQLKAATTKSFFIGPCGAVWQKHDIMRMHQKRNRVSNRVSNNRHRTDYKSEGESAFHLQHLLQSHFCQPKLLTKSSNMIFFLISQFFNVCTHHKLCNREVKCRNSTERHVELIIACVQLNGV